MAHLAMGCQAIDSHGLQAAQRRKILPFWSLCHEIVTVAVQLRVQQALALEDSGDLHRDGRIHHRLCGDTRPGLAISLRQVLAIPRPGQSF